MSEYRHIVTAAFKCKKCPISIDLSDDFSVISVVRGTTASFLCKACGNTWVHHFSPKRAKLWHQEVERRRAAYLEWAQENKLAESELAEKLRRESDMRFAREFLS